MILVVSTPPSTEPVSLAEAKVFCRIDASNTEPAPTAVTVALASPAAAGNVDNGAHRYLATFVTADGETEAGTVSSVVTVVDRTVNGKVQLSAIPLGGALVASRKLYRTIAAGSTYLLLATLADNTTTSYLDNISDASLGAGAPSSNTTSDPLITALIKAARQQAELELRRALITQTVDAYLDSFPSGDDTTIRLPPLSAITSIVYTDDAGVEQTLDAARYTVDSQSSPARVTPAYGYSWPATRDKVNAVRVRFTAGYGAASAVPACIKQWMLLQIKALYDNRDKFTPGGAIAVLPNEFIGGLLDPERAHGYL